MRKRIPVLRSPPSLAVLLFCCLSIGPAGATELTLETCEIQGLAAKAQCGSYPVYENRQTKTGRQIPLHVAVLPATGDNPKPDPIIFFAGGPGGSSVNMAAGMAGFRSEDLKQRDFVFIDYRGTGQSQPLFCPYQEGAGKGIAEALESFIPVELVDECLTALAAKADLTQYTTPIITDDIAEVLTALDYQQVNLWGGSYGTRVAMIFMRRHPQLVRTVTLEGVAPADAKAPADFATDAQTALQGWFAECAAEPACNKAFPNPMDDLTKVLTELDNSPRNMSIINPQTQSAEVLNLSHNSFVQTLRYMLYSAPQALKVPAFLHAAANGDWQPVAQTAYNIGNFLLSQLPMGLYLSVSCSEGSALITAQDAADQPGFFGDLRVRQELAACDKWVTGKLPDNFYQPIQSNAPVLLFTGERDPVTTSRWADHVQQFLPNSLNLVIPESGHSAAGLRDAECLLDIQAQLLATASVDDINATACLQGISRPAFMLTIPKDQEIVMENAALQRFSGSYSMEEGGFQLILEVTDDGLVTTADDSTLRLTPIGPMRFKIAGSPPGDHFDFIEQDGEIVAIDVIRSGVSQAKLQKQ